MKLLFVSLGAILLRALPVPLFAQGAPPPLNFRKDIPEKIEMSARYLIYLHGRIIEEKGLRPTDPKYGVYEYEAILAALEKKGFTVISEARAKDTDVKKYAAKVVEQITTLLKAGVAPDHITIVGASKGAVIAMLVSTLLANSKVNFVIMANCNDWVEKNFAIDLHGNVLSIYDKADEFGHTCQPFFDKASGLGRHKEVELQIGTGHAILYQPLKEWVDLVDDWARLSPP
ncbi:MAG: hypothetical protein QOH88_3072 [Verrucomicrobiota bacterium]|jgi:hypothetical protein